MKTPGLLYVDAEKGYKGWCGLFKKTEYQPSIIGLSHNDIWEWMILEGKYLMEGERTSNYYNRREALPEEIGEVYKLYEDLKPKSISLYFLMNGRKVVDVCLSESEALMKTKETNLKIIYRLYDGL